MSISTAPDNRRTIAGPDANSLTVGHVPAWGRWVTLGGAVAVSCLFFGLIGWNWPGVIIVAGALFVIAWPSWVRVVEGRRKASDALWSALVWGAFLLALIPLASIIVTVLSKGITGMTTPGFFTTDMTGVTGLQDRKAARGQGPVLGGVQHALVGSLLITVMASVISVPIGLLTSIWLVEYSRGGWLPRTITFLVDVMTGIPSIVAGLFASAVMMSLFGFLNGGMSQGKQTMAFTAALALSVLMIPVVVRSTEEMFRVVPNELREASYALGVRKWRTIFKVVIPTAISGIAAGVTLAVARVVGETAPILVTAGMAIQTNWNVASGWMMSLPVFIYRQLVSPLAPANPGPSELRAWGAALVLIIIVMVLNLFARFVAAKFAPKKTGR